MHRCMRTAALVAALLGAACTSTTLPTAVGVTRAQSIWVPAFPVENYGDKLYTEAVERARQEGRLNADASMTQRVQAIAARLHRHVGVFRPDATTWAWEVQVISSEDINAYNRAGGKILLMSGLVTQLALTDDELAFWLGHESAHVLREHAREKVSYAALMAGLKQASNKDLTKMPDTHAQYPHPSEREMEFEADLIGMELAARAGFEPTAAVSAIDKMERLGGARRRGYGAAHPSHESRMQRVKEKIDAVRNLGSSGR